MSKLELEEKVVLVTGASRGAGRAIAQVAADRGARVMVADRDEAGARQTAEFIAAGGGVALSAVVDVASESSFRTIVQETIAAWGRLDGMVNNAGIMVVGSALELDVDSFDRAMAVNARGAFIGSRLAVEQFRKQGSPGAIVNIASISAEVGLAGQAAYCASKGAVKMLTRQIAVDYAGDGIRCNAVSPGSIGGEFLNDYLSGLPDPEAARREIISAHPMGRVCTPEEIAEPVVFLLSDRASFITGAILPVDGGYTAR